MQTIVGTWRITVPQSEGNPEAFEALHTFFVDGNWSEINSFKDVNRGVWTGEGSSCLLTFEGYTFDAEGKHSGKLQVRAAVELRDNHHLAARWTMDTLDLQGKVTERAYYGTFEGTRMVVADPETASAAALSGGHP